MNRLVRVSLLALFTMTAAFLNGCAEAPNETDANENKGAASTPQAQPGAAQTEAARQTGSIKIASRPGGADVLLILEDESGAEAPQPRGKTPTLITDLSPGKYAVHLEKSGYSPFQKSVEVKAGETTAVTATLKRQ
ncbi:MAG TPA: PEGA domain-containing protein [Blastocatellia bacterium]|nr:PEGA domain-containing protein [Blastocatellia bacterium]